MRILAHTKKETVIACMLFLIYLPFIMLAVKVYSDYLTAFSKDPPQTFAQSQRVEGITTGKESSAPSPSVIQPSVITPTILTSPSPTVQVSTPTSLPTSVPTAAPTLPTVTTAQTITSNSNSSATQAMLDALNAYRTKKGVGTLTIDTKLQAFAESRASYFDSRGSMDNHAGFQDMMNNNGFNQMGFNALGENSSFGDFGTATNLIENIYGSHPPHDENQLKSDWTHVGIGVKNQGTDFVFGGRKQ